MRYIVIKDKEHFHFVVIELRKQNIHLDINFINAYKTPRDIELIAINKLNKAIVLYKMTPLDVGSISNKRILDAMGFRELFFEDNALDTIDFNRLRVGDIGITRDFKRAELIAKLEPKTFKCDIIFNLMWILENGSSFSTTSEGNSLISQESNLDIIKMENT